MRPVALFLFVLTFACANAYAGEIALSFNDSPRPITTYFKKNERVERLIKSLKEAKVEKAIFYSLSQTLDDPIYRTRLEAYGKAGHLIGNHSHSHPRIEKIGIESYIKDIKKSDKELRQITNFAPYFRYPFSNYGETPQDRIRLKKILTEMGYSNGYATADSVDSYMDKLLQRAVKGGKKIDYEKLKKAYVDVLWETIVFYDNLAKTLIGRSPKHILVLHENDLAALYVKDLVEHIRSKGWKIITPEEAYTDPIAIILPDTKENGNGRISAIAHARSHPGPNEDPYQDRAKVRQLFAEREIIK